MTVIDTSAIIAAAAGEPESEQVLEALSQRLPLYMSAATWVELWIVVDSRGDPTLSNDVEELLTEVEVEPVTADQADLARRAYRQYGKGSGSGARLNYGDCFSYALAKARHEPLLYVGQDFARTDLEPPPEPS
ncbi:MAG: type II toxin-antitoxin system VapC family toxin [Actinomycetia bacterium]|nr:type II toxin-antitoxin system VapC family toxin [Actinomycetes bacterium]